MTAQEIFDQARILKKAGVPMKQIAATYGLTAVELGALMTMCQDATWIANTGRARVLQKEGKSNKEIAEIMGMTESTIRLLLMTEEERKERRKLRNNIE